MTAKLNTKDLVLTCAKAAIDKKAENTLIYNVSDRSAFTDYFLITSAQSEKQVQAICNEIVRVTRDLGLKKPIVEGLEHGRWVLIDFSDVVIHVFHQYIREFYNLEELWGASPRLSVPQEYYSRTIV